MEYTKIEVIKVLEYFFDELALKVDVKIKVAEDGSFFYTTSHYYKPKNGADYYHPGAGANSIEDAIYKADNYLKDFTSDYKPNTYF